MELRRYLQIIKRQRWLVVTAFAVTTTVTFILVARQPWVYESTGTFVVRPSSVDTSEVVRAFDTLIRGVEINGTYASIARSDLIRTRAQARLDPSVKASGVRVDADVETGTNILSISVRGRDPESVRALAAVTGEETVRYVSELNDAYELSPLDHPALPKRPVGPNKPLTFAVGMVFGAACGVGLALLREYVVKAAGVTGSVEVLGPETDTYDEQFLRLGRQMRDAKRSGLSFSLGMLNVAPPNGESNEGSRIQFTRDLRRIAQVLHPTLREEDVFACLDDGTFAVMLPDMPVAEAEELLVDWELVIASILGGRDAGPTSRPQVSTGVCEHRNHQFVGDEGAKRLAWLLTSAGPG